jgi:hypothetical protein
MKARIPYVLLAIASPSFLGQAVEGAVNGSVHQLSPLDQSSYLLNDDVGYSSTGSVFVESGDANAYEVVAEHYSIDPEEMVSIGSSQTWIGLKASDGTKDWDLYGSMQVDKTGEWRFGVRVKSRIAGSGGDFTVVTDHYHTINVTIGGGGG